MKSFLVAMNDLNIVSSVNISDETVPKITFDSVSNNWHHFQRKVMGNSMQLEQYLLISKELRQYQRKIKDSLKLYQLSHIDFEVLHYLYEGLTQPGIIASEAVLNKPQVTRSMRCLEKLNLMEYDLVEHDRRVRVIKITNKGKYLYTQLVQSINNINL